MVDEGKEFQDNLGLIHLAIKNLHIYWKNNDEHQEYIDAATDGLLRAIRTYDSSRGIKKSTYYYKCISIGIKQRLYIKQEKKRKVEVVSLNQQLESDELIDFMVSDIDVEKMMLDKERREMILEAVNSLPIKKDREVVKYLYGLDGYPLINGQQLSKLLGLNKNSIYQRRNRALGKLWRIIKNEEKYEELWR